MAPLPGMPPCGRDGPPFFSSVHVGTAGSVGATFMSPAWVRCCAACAPSCLVGVCLSASVPGVINGAPTGYATVRSWCSAVFSFVHVGTAGSVGATFMSPACVRCCARVCAVVACRCLSYRSCSGRHKWRPYRICRRAVVMSRRFFIRMCGNRRVCRRAVVMARRFFIRACGNCRQRRGDIHVARVRALLWFGGMRLAVPATGVINGAPTGYVAVRS